MRELKREEYGMISGGGVTQMPTLFVNGPPPSNGVYIPSAGTGNGPRGMGEADGGTGGRALHKKAPASASLAHPIVQPKSEMGKTVDDAAQLANNFGTWLGGEAYKICHR